ncbi:MAG: LysE family translocator [Methyloceanibacter sp.]|nr:LysE family translocator [Methyloceanibacter sp.]
MRLEPLLAFIVFSIVTSVTPGPNNVMLTATGANVGVRRGMPHLLGIVFGFGAMQFIVIGGVGTALTSSPQLMLGLKIVGIVVLLWLAWKIATAGRSVAGERERPIGFFGAVAFQWINPKAWLICAGSVSFLQTDGVPAILQAALFGLIFVVTGIPCMLVWLGFGAAMQYFLRSDRALRTFNIMMGLALVATAPLLL